jgi:hypothetical protein
MVCYGAFGRRRFPAKTGRLEWAARAMHYILYLLLRTMILAGLGKIWSRGHAANFFGLFAIRPPFPIDKSWRPVANTLHYWGAWMIIMLAALHTLAALLHHCALHDDVLRRMLPSSRPVKAHRASPVVNDLLNADAIGLTPIHLRDDRRGLSPLNDRLRKARTRLLATDPGNLSGEGTFQFFAAWNPAVSASILQA